MKLVAFYKDGMTRVGIKQDENIFMIDGTLHDVLHNGVEGLTGWVPAEEALSEEELGLCPVYPVGSENHLCRVKLS